MEKVQVINLLEKYRNISRIMGQYEDFTLMGELINMIQKAEFTSNNVCKSKVRCGGNNSYKDDFQCIVSSENVDLPNYKLDDRILSNKNNMVLFWLSLKDDEKSKFTLFELNVILYLISKHFTRYQDVNKKKLIQFINQVARDKKMEDAYKNIKV